MKKVTEEDKIKRMQKNLYLLRASLGLTGDEFGNYIGVTRQTISNIESGRANLTKTQYLAIRYAVGVNIGHGVAFNLLYKVYIDGETMKIGNAIITDDNEEMYKLIKSTVPSRLARCERNRISYEELCNVILNYCYTLHDNTTKESPS